MKISNIKEEYIGLLSILIVMWLIIYVIPNFFILLFHTFLGNVILLIIVLMTASQNKMYGIGLLLLFIMLYQFSHVRNVRIENFEKREGWSDETINDFVIFQNTINSQIKFDLDILQSQASEEDAKYLLKNGKWSWNSEVQKLYMDLVSINPYIRNTSEDSLNNAMTIYNQCAILQALRMQTKEGRFLLSGITYGTPNSEDTYGYDSGLISKNDTVIKCYNNNGKNELTKIEYIGDSGGLTANHLFKKTKLDYNKLEASVPGFKFINSPCEPCVALTNPADYSCPFNLNTESTKAYQQTTQQTTQQTNYNVSPVWKYLWNL